MKTTVDLPDELLVAAKKHAVETRSTLRALIERGLRHELRGPGGRGSRPRARIRWVTVDGGLPPGADPADRASMSDPARIPLTEAQAQALGAQARAEERSMADLVRESVSEYLARRPVADRDELARRALALAGRYRSGCPDLAEEHDRYLDEAFDS